jgi:zinc protease
MRNLIIAVSALFLSFTMQAQDRPQPKPGPSPKVQVKKPKTFTLANGLKVLVVENHKLPRVSYSLNIDVAPFAEGRKKGVDDLTGALMGSGTTSISKDAFNEEVDFMGANINFSSTGAYASSLSQYSRRILELMADGALNPVFTQEELDKQRDKFIDGLKTEEKSVPAVAARVQNVLAFGKNHPSGEFLTEETLKNVTLADVQQHYNTYFQPGSAYLVVIGDVKFDEVKANVEDLFGDWKAGVAPKLSYNNPANVQYSQINFIDMPNAVQSEVALLNTTILEMGHPDYFPVLLANQVFGGDFNSYLNMNLREAHGWTYGARSSIGGSRYVQAFRAGAQVRNAVTDSAIVESLKELKRIRTEKVTKETLDNVKAGYIGRFVMQIEKPQTVARYALLTQTEGLPADFYENYIKNINKVTPDDVMRVANKYFMADNMRIVVVGKASEVLPSLEKLSADKKLPILYFDKFGNPTEKPAGSKAADISAKSVFEKYIAAIGGDKAVRGVKSLSSVMTGTIQGTELELHQKVSADKKMAVEMKVMGMTMMKQVVNEKGAYVVQQGQRTDVTGEELAEMQAGAVPFDELELMNKAGLTVAQENFNGTDAYAIKDGKTTLYYDVKTGLKLGETKTAEQGSQTRTFSDYREVKGVKYPHKVLMNVGVDIDLTMTEMKVNEGVTAADFQ